MGFFSKTCAKTHLPVVHETRGYPELCEVVVLKPNGAILRGMYDGYGRVQGENVCDNFDTDWDNTKFVLAFAYTGEKYDEVGNSGNELGQGHFMSSMFLDHCLKKKKFASRRAYEQAFRKMGGW
jgi:hypothetical protein